MSSAAGKSDTSKLAASQDSNALQPLPFTPGQQYTRNDIYTIMSVPEAQRRGNWETGYTRWGNDLFMFPTVGAPASGGYDYDNGWEGGVFRWYAKRGTHLDQPLIQWMLHKAQRVFVFTRPAARLPFTFEGVGTPVSWEDESPVMVRWDIPGRVSVAGQTPG